MNSILYKKSDNIDEATGFRCHYSYNKIEPLRLHHHDYYEIFLTITGETIHIANDNTIRLPEGSLVFIRPNDSHSYTSIGDEEYSFVNLAFDKETLLNLFDYISDCIAINPLLSSPNPPTVQLNKTEKSALLSSLDKLTFAETDNPIQKKILFKGILFTIFTKFYSTSPKRKTDVPAWLEYAVSEIKKPNNFIVGVPRFRELCNKSNEHISRCVKNYYNQSPTELINEIRLNYAANLLLYTNKSITYICYDCGFENISWFYTAFKKKYFITPKKFRENHTNRGM